MEDRLPVCTQTEYVDIGHGVTVQERRMDGVLAGLGYNHPNPDGTVCKDYIPVKSDPSDIHGWDLVSEVPLTVSPSLLCRVCGHHGFIRDGRWVPA